MKMKPIVIGLAWLCPVLTVFSQSSFDALRYSEIGIQGSARVQGFGGAGTAIGADISNLSGNPAGLGFFRKSEWTISPSIGIPTTSSSYLGTNTSSSKLYFSIPNFGLVFASPKDDIVGGKWRGGAFGISFNRIGNYQNQFTYEGVNNKNSLMDYFRETANVGFNNSGNQVAGYYLDELDPVSSQGIGYNANNQYDPSLALSQIAYFTYLLNPTYTQNTNGQYGYNGQYYAPVSSKDAFLQKETVNTTGGNYQWNLSYGGNVDNKFYFGTSLGINRMRYDVKKTFTETVIINAANDPNYAGVNIKEPSNDGTQLLDNKYAQYLNNFTFQDNFTATSIGVNLSGGFIYRPNDIIRFGVSAVTPTTHSMKEEFSQSINANFYNVQQAGGGTLTNAQDRTGNGNFTYKLRTPWRVSGGLAIFAGKIGFVTAEAEYIPYDFMNFSSKDGYDFSSNNQAIKNNFKPVVNAKVGGEARFDIYRLRTGFGYYQSPVKDNQDDLDRTRYNVTLGAGIRTDNFYVDAAIVHSRFQSAYNPYTLFDEDSPSSVIVKNRPTYLMITFGSYF